jgi:hypothetical protein
VKYYVWNIPFYGDKTWTLLKNSGGTLKVLKFGAGEGWSRSVGSIM